MTDSVAIHLTAFSALVPGFSRFWQESVEADASGSDYTLWSFYSDASHFIAEQLVARDTRYIGAVLDYVESVMKNGSHDEQDAATTCFLENILNRTPTEIEPKDWIPFLGPESRAYCRAWDNFTGCRTQYLHED